MQRIKYLGFVFVLVLAACGSADIATSTPTLTATEQPTETSTPTATATPDPVIAPNNVGNLTQIITLENQAVAWAPKGHTFALIDGEDSNISIWEVGNDQSSITIEGPAQRIAWSPDGNYLVSQFVEESEDPFYKPSLIRIWEVATGTEVGRIDGHTHWIGNMTFSPDSQTFASSDANGLIFVWHKNNDQMINKLEGQGRHYVTLAWSSDGSMFASANTGRYCSCHTVDGTVRIRSSLDGSVLAVLEGHTDFVDQVSWSPDNGLLVTDGQDSTLRVWEVPSGKPLATLRDQYFLTWTPNGQMLVTSGAGVITFWDSDAWDATKTINGVTSRIVWSPDGMIMGFIESGKIRLVDVVSGEDLMTLGETDNLVSLSWSPNGSVLAGGGNEGTVYLWDASNGELIMSLETNADPARVSWSPDGQVLISNNVAYDAEKEEFRDLTTIWINR